MVKEMYDIHYCFSFIVLYMIMMQSIMMEETNILWERFNKI